VTLQDSGVQTDLYDVWADRAAVVAVGDSGAVTIAHR
jgi:hypothetical protein